MKIYLDIETLPCNDPSAIGEIHSKVSPPKTLKKAESIASWWVDEGEQAKVDAVAKTSFDGMYGRICVICFATDDGPVEAVAGNNETQLLLEFYGLFNESVNTRIHNGTTQQEVTIVGHNVAGFDLPFIRHRSIINSIKPPLALLKAMNAKPWDSCIADTMLMWSSDREKRVSMDKLCKAFGIHGKGDFDGSMVAQTWPTDPQKVIDYCVKDVERTREIYKRLTWS